MEPGNDKPKLTQLDELVITLRDAADELAMRGELKSSTLLLGARQAIRALFTRTQQLEQELERERNRPRLAPKLGSKKRR